MGSTAFPATREVHVAATLEDARAGRHRPRARSSRRARSSWRCPAAEVERLVAECGRALAPGQRFVRGVYAGGTLAWEAAGAAGGAAAERGPRRRRRRRRASRRRSRRRSLHGGAPAPDDRRHGAPRVDRARGPRPVHRRPAARRRPRLRRPSSIPPASCCPALHSARRDARRGPPWSGGGHQRHRDRARSAGALQSGGGAPSGPASS